MRVRTSLSHVGLASVLLNRFDQPSDYGPTLGPAVRAGGKAVFRALAPQAVRPLHRIGVAFDAAIVHEPRQAVPLGMGTGRCLDELSARKQAWR
jgi:hypothetical protein